MIMGQEEVDRRIPSSKEFRGREEFRSTIFDAILALTLWLGPIYFNAFLVLISLFFLPLSKSLVVIGLLLVFMLIPIDPYSKYDKQLARYCSVSVVFLFNGEVNEFP
ncbi:hypothetical protein SLA2020_048110 [Shorea laevis]